MPEATEVQYLVLPDRTNPYLLAQVRWPDVAHAISAAQPDWQEDPGLFDLPGDPSSAAVSAAEAAEIAQRWGAQLASPGSVHMSGLTLIRRMPANWSDLAPAEMRAWSLDFAAGGRRSDRRNRPLGSAERSASASRAGRFRSFLQTIRPSLERSDNEVAERIAAFTPTPTGRAPVGNGWRPAVGSEPAIRTADVLLDANDGPGLVPVGPDMASPTSWDDFETAVWQGVVPVGLRDTGQVAAQGAAEAPPITAGSAEYLAGDFSREHASESELALERAGVIGWHGDRPIEIHLDEVSVGSEGQLSESNASS